MNDVFESFFNEEKTDNLSSKTADYIIILHDLTIITIPNFLLIEY